MQSILIFMTIWFGIGIIHALIMYTLITVRGGDKETLQKDRFMRVLPSLLLGGPVIAIISIIIWIIVGQKIKKKTTETEQEINVKFEKVTERLKAKGIAPEQTTVDDIVREFNALIEEEEAARKAASN